jgi:3-hydroxyisobutyrate dehydrogenase
LAKRVATIYLLSGLDVEQAMSILTDGVPGSLLLKAISRRMLDYAFEPYFRVPLMVKDLGYAEQALTEAGIVSAITEAATARFTEADEAGQPTGT